MKTKEENIIATKSYAFAVRCVNLYKYLCDVKNDYTIGCQLMRSGTSIGANAKEAIRGVSKADYHNGTIRKYAFRLSRALKTPYDDH